MYKCNICNSKVLLIEELYICTQCKKKLNKNQFHKVKIEKLNNSSYPEVIINEYLRIIDLLDNNQIHGALLQTKDSYELIIKTIILAIQAELYADSNKLEENYDTIFKLFEKKLSLGDWEKIGREIESKSKYKELNAILKDILSIYNKNKITKWRNDWIGHGALALESNEEFKKDLFEKIKSIENHLIKNEENYKNLNIIKENEKIKLIIGKDELYFTPFIIEKNNELYVFDSYNRYVEKVTYLNYHNGDKIQVKSNEFEDLINKIQFNNKKMTFKSKLNDNIYTSIEERIIKDISNIKDFERPEFIIKEIDDFVNENDKGVLLLKMEEGMGKSTLSMALDQNSIGKVKLNNSIVKAYYINDSYGSRIENFITSINDIFRSDKEGKIIYKGNIPTVSMNKATFKKELISLLEFYRDVYKQDYNSDKLIFIIDGLDEIVKQDNGNLFEYLPGKDDLGENIYIIYTSRTDNEMDGYYFFKNNIDRLKTTKEISITKENDYYLSFINQYLEKNYKNISTNMYSLLINKSTKSIKQLRKICNILQNHMIDIKEIHDQDEIYKIEMDIIYDKFGEKYFKIIKDIILIICQEKDGLTVSEISKLVFDDDIKFEIYFYLMNLNEILEINRTLKGNKIKINDPKLAEFMLRKNQRDISNIYDKLLSKIFIPNSNILLKYEDLDAINSYVYSNICKIVKGSNKYNIRDICLDTNLEYLTIKVDNISKNDIDSIYLRHNINTQILELIDSISKKDEQHYLMKAIAKSNEAEVYDLLGNTSQSLAKFNESIKMIEKINIEKQILLSNVIIHIYIEKGILLTRIGQNLEAINCFNYADTLYRSIQLTEKNIDEKINFYLNYENYISILINRGSAYYNMEKYELALDDFNNVIDLLEKPDMSDYKNLQLSKAYLNRGVTRIKMGHKFKEESIEDYNNALKTCNIDSIEGMVDYCTILQNLNNIELIGNKDLKEFNIDKLCEAIRILENLYEQNELVDCNVLFIAYVNIIKILIFKKEENLVTKYTKKLNSIFRKVEDDKMFIDKLVYIEIIILISDLYDINIKKEKDRLIKYYEKVIMSFDYKKINENLFNKAIISLFCNYAYLTVSNNNDDWTVINYLIDNIRITKSILNQGQINEIIETFCKISLMICKRKNAIDKISKIVEFILDMCNISNSEYLDSIRPKEYLGSIKLEILRTYGDYLLEYNEIEKSLNQYNKALKYYDLFKPEEKNKINNINTLLPLYINKSVALCMQKKFLDAHFTIEKGIFMINKYGREDNHFELNREYIEKCLSIYMSTSYVVQQNYTNEYYEVE